MKDSVKYILETSDENSECDIVLVNVNKDTDLNFIAKTEKPLLLKFEDENDLKILSEINKKCIIAAADEKNYKNYVKAALQGNHKLVIKTPIDINLAKEMNILTSDLGLKLENIIMDTDIGGLGYGLEYGYSMIEKIKLEFNDKYLNLPIISFAVFETARTKEFKDNALFLEITSASAVKAAGADYIAMLSEEGIKTMKGLN